MVLRRRDGRVEQPRVSVESQWQGDVGGGMGNIIRELASAITGAGLAQ